MKVLLEVIRVDGKIGIPVLAGLPPGQDGDTPAAANPGADARLIQGIQNTDHVFKAHIGNQTRDPIRD